MSSNGVSISREALERSIDREDAQRAATPARPSTSKSLQRCGHCQAWRAQKNGRCLHCRQPLDVQPLIGLKAASSLPQNK